MFFIPCVSPIFSAAGMSYRKFVLWIHSTQLSVPTPLFGALWLMDYVEI
jgi:hypothetical protein